MPEDHQINLDSQFERWFVVLRMRHRSRRGRVMMAAGLIFQQGLIPGMILGVHIT